MQLPGRHVLFETVDVGGAAASMSETARKPSLQTRFVEFQVVCRRCQTSWQPTIARFVNVETDPDARLGILLNRMHWSSCPRCAHEQFIDTTFEYYDPAEALVIQVRPEWEYAAGGGEDYYLKRFEDLVIAYCTIDVRVDVVFGMRQLVDQYLGGEAAVAAAWLDWNARRAASEERNTPA